MAVPGYNTMQENAVYKEIENQIQPDLVLVHYWVDDAHQYRAIGGYVVDVGDISEDAGRLVVRALPVPPGLSDFLLVHSRLYDLLTQVVVAFNRDSQSDWTRVSKPLAEIQERVQRAGGRLLILASTDLSGSSPKPVGDLARLQQFAASRGIEVVDLTDWVGGVSSKQIALDGCHFNAEGHRLIGEHLADYLLEHDLKGLRPASFLWPAPVGHYAVPSQKLESRATCAHSRARITAWPALDSRVVWAKDISSAWETRRYGK